MVLQPGPIFQFLTLLNSLFKPWIHQHIKLLIGSQPSAFNCPCKYSQIHPQRSASLLYGISQSNQVDNQDYASQQVSHHYEMTHSLGYSFEENNIWHQHWEMKCQEKS